MSNYLLMGMNVLSGRIEADVLCFSSIMAEMVASAVVQETVSGVFSYLSTSGEDQKVSEKHDMERLEMAYTELKLAVERSTIMPITEVSLLHRRKMIKRKYEECGDLLHRCKIRVAEDEDESSEQGVITRSCSFPRRIAHAAKSFFWSSLGLESSCSAAVRRFEWFADKAGQFVRDVETGCSLAHYRFFSPLNRHLLEGNNISYKMVQASQTIKLDIVPMFLEGRGCEAWIDFSYKDSMMPLKYFALSLSLRLSGSMDIVGIISKCLQLSLGPRFKFLAEDAMGKLAQIPTQDAICSAVTPGQFKSPKHCPLSRILAAVLASPSLDHSLDDLLLKLLQLVQEFDELQVDLRDAMHAVCARHFRPDPVCCTANGHGHRGNDIISSKLSYQFPEEVNYVRFKSSYITAPDFNYLSNSTNVVSSTNIVGGWPLAHLSVFFVPHCYCPRQKDRSYETTGGGDKDLRQMVEIVIPESIDDFIRHPELSYRATRCELQARGYAFFTGKIASNIGKCTTNANSMSRSRELDGEIMKKLEELIICFNSNIKLLLLLSCVPKGA